MNEAITAIERRVTDVLAEAAALVIRDQDTLTLANTKTIMIKALIKEIDDTFKPIYDAQRATAKLTKDTWDNFRVPLDMDYCRIKTSIGAYLSEQGRLKREAEHRVWLAEQEKTRAEAEASRIAEEALRKAAIAEAKGENEKAEKILEKAAAKETEISEKIQENNAIAAAPPPPPVKTVGISTRKDWDVELTDINLVPREYLMLDEVKARRATRESKGTLHIPGVKKIEKTIVSQR